MWSEGVASLEGVNSRVGSSRRVAIGAASTGPRFQRLVGGGIDMETSLQ